MKELLTLKDIRSLLIAFDLASRDCLTSVASCLPLTFQAVIRALRYADRAISKEKFNQWVRRVWPYLESAKVVRLKTYEDLSISLTEFLCLACNSANRVSTLSRSQSFSEVSDKRLKVA